MMESLAVLFLLVMAQLAGAQSPASTGATAPAQSSADQVHRSDDIARHRQVARAHEQAAKCLEAGNSEKQCQGRLHEACKGIAVGQYCGMQHAH